MDGITKISPENLSETLSDSQFELARTYVFLGFALLVIILILVVYGLFGFYNPFHQIVSKNNTYVVCNGQTYNLNQNPLACDTTSNYHSNVVFCQDSYYTVYTGYYTSDSTGHGTVTTHSSNTSFTTTTSVTQTVGYVTSTENNYTGTLTGAIAEWTVSACTYTTSP